MLEPNQETIDRILTKYHGQPVGDGYWDIIVKRENYPSFIREILEQSVMIIAVSWWEFCPKNVRNQYGMGGPLSWYYDGWFAELQFADDFDPRGLSLEEMYEKLVYLIKNRTFEFIDETFSFSRTLSLHPGFCLKVPDGWKNSSSRN